MKHSRLIAGVVGVFTASVGILFFVMPSAVRNLTTSSIVVSTLALIALTQAIIIAGRKRSMEKIGTPDPEYRTITQIPGASFDRGLHQLRPRVRHRLESAAVAVLTQVGEETVEDARRRLAEGTWTDDSRAAAFFSTDVVDDYPGRPVWLGGEPRVVKQALAAVSKLAEISTERSGGISIPDHVTSEWADRVPSDRGADLAPHNQKDGPGGDLPLEDEAWDRKTERWSGIEAIALFTVAAGTFLQEPPILLIGVMGVALTVYAAYGRAVEPEPISLSINRRHNASHPVPGDDVVVRVTICNESGRLLPDLRVIDGVPAALVVTDGSPRHAASLRPGETTTFSYGIEADYGKHVFQPPLVIARDATGEHERVFRAADDALSIKCYSPSEAADGVSLEELTTRYVGQVASNDGGRGIEFQEMREYQRGDPISLINWKGLAKTGELTTLQFREQRMAKVMLIIDARQAAYVAPSPTERTAVAQSIGAADVLVQALLDAKNQIGITALSPEQCWLAPNIGRSHKMRARRLLANNSAFTMPPSAEPCVMSIQLARLRRRISDETQAIVLSPLCDDAIVDFVKNLEASGTPTSVISPNPTTETTPGGILSRLERLARTITIRQTSIPVYDWDADESLGSSRNKQRARVNHRNGG